MGVASLHTRIASKPRQVSDWKAGHKKMCEQLREMREGGAARIKQPLNRQNVMARILGRVRLYLCPFAVCHGEVQGRGFVFVQVNPVAFGTFVKKVSAVRTSILSKLIFVLYFNWV